MILHEVQVELRSPGQGYIVQAAGHRLERGPENAPGARWRCSCGFCGSSDEATFDLLHLALRLYAERSELYSEREQLRETIARFLCKEASYRDLRRAIAGLR